MLCNMGTKALKIADSAMRSVVPNFTFDLAIYRDIAKLGTNIHHKPYALFCFLLDLFQISHRLFHSPSGFWTVAIGVPDFPPLAPSVSEPDHNTWI